MLERYLEERLDNLRLRNRLYVLQVIRQGDNTWEMLIRYFGLKGIGITEKLLLAEALNILQEAGIISFVGSLKDDGRGHGIGEDAEDEPAELGIAYNDASDLHSIEITDRGTRLLSALGISLKEHSKVLKGITVVGRPYFRLHEMSHDVFVAMPFVEEHNAMYRDHLLPLLHDLNLSVVRADDFATSNTIIVDIFNSVRSARFIIADCTGRNANVFYEVGLAHALGKPVILLTQTLGDIPFDVAHLRHIRYEMTDEGLRELGRHLKRFIRSVVGS